MSPPHDRRFLIVVERIDPDLYARLCSGALAAEDWPRLSRIAAMIDRELNRPRLRVVEP